MSIKIMTAVWENGPDHPSRRFLLLAIADNANDHGVCWPSIKHLSAKCSMSERTVLYAVGDLEHMGWLTIEHDVIHGRGSRYQINLAKLLFKATHPDAPGAVFAGGDSRLMQTEHETDANSARTPANSAPDECKIRHPNKEEPSLNRHRTVNEPKTPPASLKKPSENGGRHAILEELIKNAWQEANGVLCPWDGSEGKALKQMLAANPSWTRVQWTTMIHNLFASEDKRKKQRPRIWLPHIGEYAVEPLDRFGNTKSSNTHNTRAASNGGLRNVEDVLAEMHAKRDYDE